LKKHPKNPKKKKYHINQCGWKHWIIMYWHDSSSHWIHLRTTFEDEQQAKELIKLFESGTEDIYNHLTPYYYGKYEFPSLPVKEENDEEL